MLRQPRPRLRDFSYIGKYAYFLTFCTCNRRCVFTRADFVNNSLTHFLRVAAEKRFKQTAYIFMPDHVHLIVRGLTEDSNLRSYEHRVKQKTGFDYRLVKDPRDYPYWGTSDWTREEVLEDLRAHPDDDWTPPPRQD